MSYTARHDRIARQCPRAMAVYLPGVGVGIGVVAGVGADSTGVGEGEAATELSAFGEGDGLAFAVLPFVRA
jgi:hypothetical protein